VARYDLDNFEKQFKRLQPKAQEIVALRSGLRVLPVLAYRRHNEGEPFAFWNVEDRRRYALSTIRCYQASVFVNSLTKADRSASAAVRAAASAADAAASAVTYNAVYARAAARAAASAVSVHEFSASAAVHAAAEAVANDASHAVAVLADAQRPDLGKKELGAALASPLWPTSIPVGFAALLKQLTSDLRSLDAGFEIWMDWYQDRLDGKPFNWELERQWALLSKEQLSQSPAEINAYLKELRDRASVKQSAATKKLKQFKRVRAIFIGHGEVGKTSLIKALHGGDVIAGQEVMTQGVAIQDAIHEQAGVFVRVTDYKDDHLTVHFWDFGGQVMAHATHQFFLRSKCLYVIVLEGRAGHNPNEDAEYWLEHVRAFGDSAPVLIVGNKADVMPVQLDMRTLKEKYPNIVGFYTISCTQAKGAHRTRFEAFQEELNARLVVLGEQAERFTPDKFKVLKTIEEKAARDDFLSEADFDHICRVNGVAMEGPGGRDGLLDLFDKLGIVMHFQNLPYLTEYVLNPRWLTYGVYAIMYSEEAKAALGRLSETQLVAILKKANPTIPNGHAFCYPPDRCQIVANAMIAFQVAYRLGTGELVIPALLPPGQPKHDFKPDGAISFQFDFKGFLPRHVLPALIVERFLDIAKIASEEIVWQNGVLLRPHGQYDAEALVRADYHTRTIDILTKGSDANLYLGVLRDCILRNLKTMPQLPFDERVQLRPEMRAAAEGFAALSDKPILMDYGSILGAQKLGIDVVVGADGKPYSVRKVLAFLPAPAALRQADVFLSYAREDRALIESLADEIESANIPAWFDRELVGGEPFRSVLKSRIETTKAVVVLWTEHSIGKKWVIAEAELADKHDKLICLRDAALDPSRIPMPFAANHHMVTLGDTKGLMAALVAKGAKPRI
jgi:GTPase SAR1 family protein